MRYLQVIVAANCLLFAACLELAHDASKPAPVDTFLPDTTPPDDTGPAEDTAEDVDTSVADTAAADTHDDTAAIDTSIAGTPDTVEADTTPVDTTPMDTGPTACDPPLAFEKANFWTYPFGPAQFVGTGGTGQYRFSLASADATALIDPLLGAYIGGPDHGLVDDVRMVDLGCVGEATGTVTLVEPMVVTPQRVELTVGQSFTPHAAKGSGSYAFATSLDTSNGSIALDGTYTAGASTGRADVVVTDALSGQYETIIVSVVADAVLTPRPGVVYLQVGAAPLPLTIDGGSGFTQSVSDNASIVVDGGLAAVAAGEATVTVTDTFTGIETELTVVGVAPQAVDATRTGFQQYLSNARGGDIDGDGYADVVYANPETSLSGALAGAIFIYPGTADGPSTTPARIITGGERRDLAGRGLVLADFNGDDLLDLAVGVAQANDSGTDTGNVDVYYGVAGAFFEDEPSWRVRGDHASDWLGFSLATCDVDNDGIDDLIAGAWLDEDRTAVPRANDQGALWVYKGSAGGLQATPLQKLYGIQPDAELPGEFTGAAGVRLGGTTATGDFDGDGLCDVVSGSYTWSSDKGAAMVFRGNGDGFDSAPVAHWVGDETSRLAWYLDTGDVNGDGKSDIILSNAYRRDYQATQRDGSTHVVLGGDWATTPSTEWTTTADVDWTFKGPTGSYDYYGYCVAAADVDGDGIDDVVSGAWLEEGTCDDCEPNSGMLTVHFGVADQTPAAEPDATLYGTGNADRFGSGVWDVGDIDGDGAEEILAFAALADGAGPDVGEAALVDFDGAQLTRVTLEVPGDTSGWRVGRSIAIIGDADGDGFDELAVGAPDGAPLNTAGNRLIYGGFVDLYRGTADGFEATAYQRLAGFAGHTAADRVGWDVSSAGDFDGDGLPDLAVVARYDDKANNLPAAWLGKTGCISGNQNNVGSVFLFSGNADGTFGPEPAYIIYGRQANDTIQEAASAGDIDGDGFDDIIFGGQLWDRTGAANCGGFGLVRGRARTDTTQVEVICEYDISWLSGGAGDQAGTSLTTLGDLDNDGCDEFGVGAFVADIGGSNRGGVLVVLGHGPDCARATAESFFVLGTAANDFFGFSSSGGVDLDGDGLAELAVGGYEHRTGGVATGGAWLIDGRRLAELVPDAVALPAQAIPAARFDITDGPLEPWTVEGWTNNQDTGVAVALIPQLGPSGTPALAVAHRGGDLAGLVETSLVTIHPVEVANGAVVSVQNEPAALFLPEAGRYRTATDAGLAVTVRSDHGVLATSFSDSSAQSTDLGAAFWSSLEPIDAYGGAP